MRERKIASGRLEERRIKRQKGLGRKINRRSVRERGKAKTNTESGKSGIKKERRKKVEEN